VHSEVHALLLEKVYYHVLFLCLEYTVTAFSIQSMWSITTDTTSNLGSACVVLALMAGHQDCQP